MEPGDLHRGGVVVGDGDGGGALADRALGPAGHAGGGGDGDLEGLVALVHLVLDGRDGQGGARLVLRHLQRGRRRAHVVRRGGGRRGVGDLDVEGQPAGRGRLVEGDGERRRVALADRDICDPVGIGPGRRRLHRDGLAVARPGSDPHLHLVGHRGGKAGDSGPEAGGGYLPVIAGPPRGGVVVGLLPPANPVLRRDFVGTPEFRRIPEQPQRVFAGVHVHTAHHRRGPG